MTPSSVESNWGSTPAAHELFELAAEPTKTIDDYSEQILPKRFFRNLRKREAYAYKQGDESEDATRSARSLLSAMREIATRSENASPKRQSQISAIRSALEKQMIYPDEVVLDDDDYRDQFQPAQDLYSTSIPTVIQTNSRIPIVYQTTIRQTFAGLSSTDLSIPTAAIAMIPSTTATTTTSSSSTTPSTTFAITIAATSTTTSTTSLVSTTTTTTTSVDLSTIMATTTVSGVLTTTAATTTTTTTTTTTATSTTATSPTTATVTVTTTSLTPTVSTSLSTTVQRLEIPITTTTTSMLQSTKTLVSILTVNRAEHSISLADIPTKI
ncbi:hypothetical protein FB639_000296 [Coemansia asiatica]|nr:hypothetical protein FB639_000296 [Coemansia asiatica]